MNICATETKERYELELSRLREPVIASEDQRTEGDGASVDTATPVTSARYGDACLS